jgi:hypothetical protein
MGYRSDVALALSREDHAKLVKACVPPGDLDSLLFLTPNDEDDNEDAVVLHWENVKWYDDNPLIGKIASFIGDLDEETFGFVRIGEADDDTAILGNPWNFGISVCRRIEIS